MDATGSAWQSRSDQLRAAVDTWWQAMRVTDDFTAELDTVPILAVCPCPAATCRVTMTESFAEEIVRRRLVAGVVPAVVVAGLAHATVPGEPGRLVLEITDTETWQTDLYSILPEGTGLELIASGGSQPVSSPRGRHVARIVGGEDRSVVDVVDIRTGVSFQPYWVPAPMMISGLAWSPDAQWLAVGVEAKAGFGDVALVPLVGGAPQHVVSLSTGEIGPRVDWSPRGDLLAVTVDPAAAGLMIATVQLDGSELNLLAEGGDPSWSPDGAEILFVGSGGTSIIGADGTGLRVIPGLEVNDPPGAELGVGFSPVWSPAGDQIAVTGFQGVGALIINVGTGEARTLYEQSGQAVYDVDWAVANGTGPFADVPDTHRFFADVGWLYAGAITGGCNPPLNDLFCVEAPATRGQVAAFLTRTFDLTAPEGDDPFVDDDGSIFEGDIEALVAAGITRGCNPPQNDRFCPQQPATRGHIAAFLVRALALDPLPDADTFIDDDTSVFEGEIEALAAAGITRGCDASGLRFCPTELVARGQIAVLLHRALGERCVLFGECR